MAYFNEDNVTEQMCIEIARQAMVICPRRCSTLRVPFAVANCDRNH